jgi:cell envelope opacity-associated protein A
VGDAVQQCRPLDGELLVHQLLRCRPVFDPRKAVVLPPVLYPRCLHLPRQPLAAVDPHVHRERKPALQPEVHEAKLRMQMVKIEMLALAAFQFQFQPFGLAIAA